MKYNRRKLNLAFFIKSSKGSGIILSLLIISISTTLILLLMDINKNNNESQKAFRDSSTVFDLVAEISMLLNNSNICKETLLGIDSREIANNIVTKIVSSGNFLYQVGSTIKGVKIVSYKISNEGIPQANRATSDGNGNTYLSIVFKRYKTEVTKKIVLNIKVDLNLKIQECSANITSTSTNLDSLTFRPIELGKLPSCNQSNKGLIVFYRGYLSLCRVDGWRFVNQ